MQVESQPQFQTQMAIGNTNLNLLSHRDATKVFNITITSGGSTLQPKATVGAVEGDNILPPLEETEVFNPTHQHSRSSFRDFSGNSHCMT